MAEDILRIESKEHYSYVTRSAIRLFNEGALTNVVGIDVEPEYGYISRLQYSDGSYRVTYGNDLGLNSGASEDLASDKGHTKFLLRTIGVNCPEGQEFLLPWWAETIAPNQEKRGNAALRTTDQAATYINETLGYPVYIKPVSGSKGLGVQKVDTEDELNRAFCELETTRSRVAIVEDAIDMPDYRVVVLDGGLISAYRRDPLAVQGDGESSVYLLLQHLQDRFDTEGRDTVIDVRSHDIRNFLLKRNMDFDTVPDKGCQIVLADVSNLSAGGTSVDVTDEIHDHWIDLSSNIAKHFNLRLCGVDLACNDIADGTSDYSVLEVNSTPGLDHYASSGEDQKRIVDELYTKVLNALPS